MLQSRGIIILLVGLLILGLFSIFVVDERERAMKLQFGKIVRSDYTPGLYFKAPFVQNVEKFDARVQNLDAEPELYLTIEKKNLIVDSFVKWRIGEVERFFTTTGGDLRLASDRLAAFIQKGLKDEFGKRTLTEVVSGERAQVMDILEESMKDKAAALGIEIVDVRIKRIDLPEEVSNSVYQRMAAERQEVAKDFRSRGEEAAKIIRAKADREREVMLAEAERDAQRIRGAGDARAAEIYANAYQQNPEFYALYRSLNAYKTTFDTQSDLILLQPDNEFFKYFNSAGGQQAGTAKLVPDKP